MGLVSLAAVILTGCGASRARAHLTVYVRSTGAVVTDVPLGVGWAESVWLQEPNIVVVSACNPVSWVFIDSEKGAVTDRRPYGGSSTVEHGLPEPIAQGPPGPANSDPNAGFGLLPLWLINTEESSALTAATPATVPDGITLAVGSRELRYDNNVQRLTAASGWTVPATQAKGKNVVYLVHEELIYLVWNATTAGCPRGSD